MNLINNTVGNLNLRVYISRLEKRVGICSQQYDNRDKHCLLWDFDYLDINKIIHSLKVRQMLYDLPSIYVVQSSPSSYHAYCLVARSFREVINILSATPEIDMTYLRMGIVRGYFTLRITPRKGEPKFKLVELLTSDIENEMSFDDLTINEYLTSNKGGKHNATRT